MKTNCRCLLPLALAAALHLAPLASAQAEHETFDLQSYIFCPTGTWCGMPSEKALRDSYFRQIGEMNLEYQPTGFSFRALDPIIIQDDHFSTWSGSTGTAGDGTPNAELYEEMLDLFARPFPERQTMLLAPDLPKCWNGVPCPGDGNEGFDSDDVIHCVPPGANTGRVYAHEMGHNFCLRHTFTFKDSKNGSAVDHDGDSASCPTLTNVPDTPDDPGVKEKSDTSNGVPVDFHEWCTTAPAGVDAGSPHASSCTIQCWQALNGTLNPTAFAPLAQDAMSYYGPGGCRGPYVIGGVRHEAFTPGQIAQIQECRSSVAVRSELVDVCPFPDGDKDFDGWCDSEDTCPNHANTWIVDDDGDGVPNPCDLCPSNPNPSVTDTDQDGVGDLCDVDDDNDGCDDATDNDPLEAGAVVGVVFYANCNPQTGPLVLFEGEDTDSDGTLNCADNDDDNDGIPDDDDSCPASFGKLCTKVGPSCPLVPIWDVCMFGGCNEFFGRIRDVINPDPTTDVIFESFQVVGEKISLGALPGHTLGESARAFTGQLPGAGGALPGGKLVLEIVVPAEKTLQKGHASDPYRIVATLGTWEARDVELGSIVGRRLEIEPPTDRTPPRVAGSWAAGAPAGMLPEDRDRDRIPDFADVCLDRFDPDQRDTDGDSFGDACDADLDQDGRISERDTTQVRDCVGVDLRAELVSVEDDQLELPPLVPNDPQGALRQSLCRSADFDGSGIVDRDDLAYAEAQRGLPPGPCGLMAPFAR